MLYFIASPIGNLNDISLRSIDVLKKIDFIYAEDTRNTKKLLNFFEIKKNVSSLHEHNESQIAPKILDLLKENNDVAILSDAGMPAISDPGYYLITQCIKEHQNFTVLPGPSSVINALVLSGMPPSSFLFLGFIPRKKKQKEQFLSDISNDKHTLILFETVKRLPDTILILDELYSSNINISICREMTKLHEEVIRGNANELLEMINNNKIILKGEVVLVIDMKCIKDNGINIDNKVRSAFLEKLPPKDAAKLLSIVTGESKRDIYKSLMDL
jgi:16S rRNA (cytidine1402-2'-O)-methyltransferase